MFLSDVCQNSGSILTICRWPVTLFPVVFVYVIYLVLSDLPCTILTSDTAAWSPALELSVGIRLDYLCRVWPITFPSTSRRDWWLLRALLKGHMKISVSCVTLCELAYLLSSWGLIVDNYDWVRWVLDLAWCGWLGLLLLSLHHWRLTCVVLHHDRLLCLLRSSLTHRDLWRLVFGCVAVFMPSLSVLWTFY